MRLCRLVLLLVAAVSLLASRGAAVRHLVRERRADRRMQAAMAEVDSQVEDALRLHANEAARVAALTAGEKEEGGEEKKADPKAAAEANVALKNSLDLRTMTVDLTPGKKEKQPRSVVVAFLSIAWEAMQRGNYAIQYLDHTIFHLKEHLRQHLKGFKEWTAAQVKASQEKIKGEIARIGKAQDELLHLEAVYKDALGKERSYESQAKQLVTERQLQTTPPVMPSVAATILPEAQFKQTIAKLEKYRQAAKEIMDKSDAGITQRKKLIEVARVWVNKSEATLKEWQETQELAYKRQEELAKQQEDKLKKRLANIKVLTEDARKQHREYLLALHKVDLQERIAQLKKQLEHYKGAKGTTSYDATQAVTYVESLKLEIKALEDQLSKAEGDDKVSPPPAQWGILSGFHSPGTFGPLQGANGVIDQSVMPGADPLLAYPAAHSAALDSMAGGEAAEGEGEGEGEGEAAKAEFREQFAGAPSPPPAPHAAAVPPVPGAAAGDDEEEVRHPVREPVMPHLPPPPDAGLFGVAAE